MGIMMGNIEDAILATGAVITVTGVTVSYTRSFPINHAEYFGIWVKATSAGTPAIKIELEESYTTPTTEGSSDTNYVVPDGFANVFASLGDTLAHVKTLSPVPMKYARFKVTGLSGADSTLTIKLFRQERS